MTDLYGCGDHGCIYGHPGGMGTNGGCGCWRALTRAAGADGRKAVRQILALRAERDQLQAKIDRAFRLIRQAQPHDNLPGPESWYDRAESLLRGEP